MKRYQTALIAIVAIVAALVMVVVIGETLHHEQPAHADTFAATVDDVVATVDTAHAQHAQPAPPATPPAQPKPTAPPETINESQPDGDADVDAPWDDSVAVDDCGGVYSGSESMQGNVDGLNSFDGVNYYDGRTETYYSSNVAYHYRTPEWSVDDEGFYRTDEGYYVVAASDMPEGTVFEGSKGECIVMDSGCDDGVTDYYVNWN